jgi:ABC-2 type transport system permease protein
MNFLHVFGIFYRNVILIRRSVPKLFALFGFITVELFLWGFITRWIEDFGPAGARLDFILLILSAFIFWSVFELSQRSFSVSFLEEVWSRNVINLFASPVKLNELVLGLALVGVVQALLAFFYIVPIAFLRSPDLEHGALYYSLFYEYSHFWMGDRRVGYWAGGAVRAIS